MCVSRDQSPTKSCQEVVIDIHGVWANLLDPFKHGYRLVLLGPNCLQKKSPLLVSVGQSWAQHQSFQQSHDSNSNTYISFSSRNQYFFVFLETEEFIIFCGNGLWDTFSTHFPATLDTEWITDDKMSSILCLRLAGDHPWPINVFKEKPLWHFLIQRDCNAITGKEVHPSPNRNTPTKKPRMLRSGSSCSSDMAWYQKGGATGRWEGGVPHLTLRRHSTSGLCTSQDTTSKMLSSNTPPPSRWSLKPETPNCWTLTQIIQDAVNHTGLGDSHRILKPHQHIQYNEMHFTNVKCHLHSGMLLWFRRFSVDKRAYLINCKLQSVDTM